MVVASATLSTRRTVVLAVAAVVAAIVIGGVHGRLVMVSGAVRVIGVAAVGAFCVLASHWRERREGVLQRVTRVAEVAQLAILRPIPSRVGSMTFATRYISAADQAFIGGDLYEVVPSATGVRVVVGDVRGKGLEAVRLAGARARLVPGGGECGGRTRRRGQGHRPCRRRRHLHRGLRHRSLRGISARGTTEGWRKDHSGCG